VHLSLFCVVFVAEPMLGTSTTVEVVTKRSERKDYDALAQVILQYLYKTSTDVNITSILTEEQKTLLTPSMRLSLPGPTVGHTIRLEGTIGQLNEAMRHLFFIAINNTYGNVTLLISLEDQATHCELPSLTYAVEGQSSFTISNSKASTDYFVQPAVYPILPLAGYNQSATIEGGVNFTSYLCDSVSMQKQKHISTSSIPLFVIAVNNPATITIKDEAVAKEGRFISVLDQQGRLPLIEIADRDHNENVANLKSSFGVPITPPVSVFISANGGRFSFPVTDGVYLFNQGGTYLVPSAVLQGSIPDVNNVLAAALYICQSNDGCVHGYEDTITISVDDLGFYGKGGPQVTIASIRVIVP
jgi:hypothetical protein